MIAAVLGTGIVGQAIAGRLEELGHAVTVGTRDPDVTRSRSQPPEIGGLPFRVWQAAHPCVGLATFAEAAHGASVVVNATSGSASMEVLGLAGAQNLRGKILLDVANPPDLGSDHCAPDGSSLGERIQRGFPATRVVKALNTLTAHVMVYPAELSEPTTVFVAGDDADAKKTVSTLLASFGHSDIIDLGDISAARGTELMHPLSQRLAQTLGGAMFNIRVVR